MWLLLLASALWTDAPARLVAGHLGIYGLVLLLPGIAAYVWLIGPIVFV
jgi:hypothetical protein